MTSKRIPRRVHGSWKRDIMSVNKRCSCTRFKTKPFLAKITAFPTTSLASKRRDETNFAFFARDITTVVTLKDHRVESRIPSGL